jgi:hypothetical protein
MATVLALATRYDEATLYTYTWAADLQQELIQQGHACMFLDGGAVCLQGSLLRDAISAADYVIFYGHGLQDELTALPPQAHGPTTPLVDVGSVQILAGRPVYAGCCHSLGGLGRAYAASGGTYIGYDNTFGFEFMNERYFKDVVNLSVSAFVNGQPPMDVTSDLRAAWQSLRDEFFSGRLRHNRNAVMASHLAQDNANRIGHLP